MAAAVADYTPVKKSKGKIKKDKSNLTIKLKPTPDILKWAGKNKNKSRAASRKRRIIVGFALEDKNLRQNAEKKLKEKNLDMIVANKPEAIGSEKSVVHIKISNQSWLELALTRKAVIAKQIIRLTENILL
jgi:phosphopantothenoylcysteine decarboxylase/phosphopantothenate--cysteine ligase